VKAVSTARSPFPWFGGKQAMADRILSFFPPHRVYCEVFGGGASVLLSKAPATLDVYNDTEDGLVNFFRILRDQPEQLVPLLELTPYARTEFLHCVDTWRTIDDPVERARRFYVVVSQCFGGHAVKDDRSGKRGWGGERLGRMHLSRAASTANRVDHIWRFVERMRSVQVDNLDWRACLQRYDHADTVFYLDPPYVPSTRRSGSYSHELTEDDHRELVERVLELAGVAIVSGYDHQLYEPLTGGGFTKHEYAVFSTAGQRSVDVERDRRIEVVWASPRANHGTLFHTAEATG
jgi:DNA adenine methylase